MFALNRKGGQPEDVKIGETEIPLSLRKYAALTFWRLKKNVSRRRLITTKLL